MSRGNMAANDGESVVYTAESAVYQMLSFVHMHRVFNQMYNSSLRSVSGLKGGKTEWGIFFSGDGREKGKKL